MFSSPGNKSVLFLYFCLYLFIMAKLKMQNAPKCLPILAISPQASPSGTEQNYWLCSHWMAGTHAWPGKYNTICFKTAFSVSTNN